MATGKRAAEVRYDPEKQLQLNDREAVVARLLYLVATRGVPVAEAEGADVFHKDLQTSVQEVLKSDASAEGERKALDERIAEMHRETERRVNGASPAAAERLRVLGESISVIKCRACGPDPTPCRGFADDALNFEDAPGRKGGQCVGFVRELTRKLLSEAEMQLKRLGGPEVGPARPVRLRMTRRDKGSRATLPVDGSFTPDADEAVLTLKWPRSWASGEMDEAILMLPYLIFHEVFVHGGQGRAAERLVKDIDNDCRFTEGTVDGLACKLLIDKFFARRNALPATVRRLKEHFRTACNRYNDARCYPPDPRENEDEEMEDDYQILQARFSGRNHWRWLCDLQERNPTKVKPDWPARCVIALNLRLDPDQRRELSGLLEFIFGPHDLDVQIIGAFEAYLRTCDWAALKRNLEEVKRRQREAAR